MLDRKKSCRFVLLITPDQNPTSTGPGEDAAACGIPDDPNYVISSVLYIIRGNYQNYGHNFPPRSHNSPRGVIILRRGELWLRRGELCAPRRICYFFKQKKPKNIFILARGALQAPRVKLVKDKYIFLVFLLKKVTNSPRRAQFTSAEP